jgi:hypothetical protein
MSIDNPEFIGFPKMARLSREVIVTEKIDGTNGQIFIDDEGKQIHVGSRTRWITKETDNHGFHKWVMENYDELMKLGPGRHFGEWWGSGIQRGYGLAKGEKRFSLFNTLRWVEKWSPAATLNELREKQEHAPECCHVVPILYHGMFDMPFIQSCLDRLEINGSAASPGFDKPEGIIVYHIAGNIGFKKTIDKDETPKSLA